MNSKPWNTSRWVGCVLGFAMLGILASGCGDQGPTNLYSNPLFGQNQAGANMQIAGINQYPLGAPGVGPDQYVINLFNAGSGGAMGPLTGVVTLQSSCGAYIESYGGVTETSQTVFFGAPAQAIYPGDTLAGYASNMGGTYQYSLQVAFPASCANQTDTFNLSVTDSKGDRWTGSFTGTND